MSLNRPHVYLSGPITGLTYEGCSDWREYAEKWLHDRKISSLSPMRGYHGLKGHGAITDVAPKGLSDALANIQGIVGRDRFDVQNCDFMLVNLLGAKRVSIGTVIEVGWADAWRKPIVVVMEPEGNLHEHGFIRHLATYRVTSLMEAMQLIEAALT